MAKFVQNSLPLYNVVKHEKMREYSDGIRIGGGLKFRPAPYLPIKEYDENLHKGVVIKKGDFVTLDENGYLVPAFVGEKALDYTALDVAEGVYDIDDFGQGNAKVSAAKTSTLKIGTTATADVKIGKPFGIAMYDVYAWDMDADPWYQVQNPVTVLADRMILLAIDTDHNSVAYESGDILVLDDKGFPVPFSYSLNDTDTISLANSVKSALDSLKYAIGRVVKVIDINADPEWRGGLEYVEYRPEDFEIDLPGKANGGVTDGIDKDTKKGLLIQLEF